MISLTIQRFIPYLRWLVTISLLFLIGYQLFRVKDYSLLVDNVLFVTSPRSILLIVLTFLLMPFNWVFEAKKWQLVMDEIEYLPFLEALKVVLAGISLGFITPAKLGDYGARILLSKQTNKQKALVSTLYSSLAQNFCNLSIGFVLGYLFLNYTGLVTKLQFNLLSVYVLLQIIIMTLIYFSLLKYIPGLNKLTSLIGTRVHNFFTSMYVLNNKSRIKLIAYSLLRYIVYLLQFLLILQIWQIPSSLLLACSGVALLFLFQSIFPLPSFLGLIWRSELAIIIFGAIGFSASQALITSLLIWLINLFIPALFGVYIVHKLDYQLLAKSFQK